MTVREIHAAAVLRGGRTARPVPGAERRGGATTRATTRATSHVPSHVPTHVPTHVSARV